MKKLSLVLVVLFFVGIVAYGQSCETHTNGNDRVIKGKDIQFSPGGKITLKGGDLGIGGSIIIKPGDGYNGDGNVIVDLAPYSRVGIGISSPGEKLEVNGNIKLSGNNKITSGGILTIEGSPNLFPPATLRLEQASNAYLYGGDGGGEEHDVILAHTGSEARGKVGIGTDDPNYKLEVYDGQLAINEPNGNPEIRFLENGTPQYTFQYKPANNYFTISEYDVGDHFVIKDGGNVGIGTTDPDYRLDVTGTGMVAKFGNGTSLAQISIVGDDEAVRDLSFCTHDADHPRWVFRTGSESESGSDAGSDFSIVSRKDDGSFKSTCLRIERSTGNVGIGIGTASPQSKLAVNGTITTREVIVTEDGWPDFVFSDNYKLMPLDKLEGHIKVNKSLPGIPTEKEVLKNGVKVGDMQAKLLEKVEELTLYTIAQEKRLTQLEKENEKLRNRISALEK